MKFHPLGERILVKEIFAEEITKSGIYEVVAVGDGAAAKMFKLGQKVVAGKYSGGEVEMKDDKDVEYKILFVGSEKNESDILALIE